MSIRSVTAGVAGGLVAGALVGLLEALASWFLAHGAGELPPIAWGLVVYGLLGAAAGFGLGVIAGILRTDGFGLALAVVGAGLGFVVARFRIVRDVFLEQLPPGVVTLAVQGVAALATAALAVLLWRWLRGADSRGSALTRPAVAAAVVGVLALGWSLASPALVPLPPPPAAPSATPPAGAPSVLLIAVDTLRADHLGAYGYARAKTPHIDALAARGVRAAEAFAQSSWTRPSFATIFTSLYPSSHGAVHKANVLPDRVETLAEVMAAAGWYTAGFPNNANIVSGFNFGQGFAEYEYLAPELFFWADEPASKLTFYNGLRLVRERFLARRVNPKNYYQPGEVVTDRALAWLDGPAAKRGPFLLFLHYMDPHDPYFVHPYDGEGYARVANPNPPPEVAEKYRALYDGEIAYLDEQVGRLLAGLEQRGLFDRTLILFTSDHGEEFFEHGGWWHGTTLYDEQIHVPFIVKPPAGGARGEVVTELVTSLDVMPTILKAVGLSGPSVMQGHAIPLDGGAAPARDGVFAEEDLEGNVLQALRTKATKLITANPGNPRGLAPEELYDMAADPGETKNQAAADPVKLEEMRAALGRSFLSARAHAGAVATTEIDAATRKRLEALGYLNE